MLGGALRSVAGVAAVATLVLVVGCQSAPAPSPTRVPTAAPVGVPGLVMFTSYLYSSAQLDQLNLASCPIGLGCVAHIDELVPDTPVRMIDKRVAGGQSFTSVIVERSSKSGWVQTANLQPR